MHNYLFIEKRTAESSKQQADTWAKSPSPSYFPTPPHPFAISAEEPTPITLNPKVAIRTGSLPCYNLTFKPHTTLLKPAPPF